MLRTKGVMMVTLWSPFPKPSRLHKLRPFEGKAITACRRSRARGRHLEGKIITDSVVRSPNSSSNGDEPVRRSRDVIVRIIKMVAPKRAPVRPWIQRCSTVSVPEFDDQRTGDRGTAGLIGDARRTRNPVDGKTSIRFAT